MADAAASTASSINQEQLLHELESKYFTLKREFSLVESERQSLVAEKQAAGKETERVTKLLAEQEEETRQLKQQLLQVTTENDALTFKFQTATSMAERRLSEVEELQTTVREQTRLLVDAQRQEVQALERAAQLEAQVAPLTHALKRAKKEMEAAQHHSQWLEAQVAEKTKTVQELRQQVAKRMHEVEELKVRSTEDITSLKRQLESARLANKMLEGSLIKRKQELKELQAAKVHDEEALENELNAQRRLAQLYQESAEEATARGNELQTVCNALRQSLADSEQALAQETERTKAQVEHLFQEQAQASEKQLQALQTELQHAEKRIQELEANKLVALQRASAVADLSSTVGEAQLAAQGLTPKELYDQILALEETLQAERNEKDKLQVYMDRIVKEVQEKAPVLMGLRLEHERTVASHTQVSERLEHCLQELTKSQHKEQQALKDKKTLEKKCQALEQSVDDLSKQVQHLLLRSMDKERSRHTTLDVGSENLVVFQDIHELQTRNQQLLTVIRELTEMNKAISSEKDSEGFHSEESVAPRIISGDESDDEMDQIAIKKRLSMACKEIQDLRLEREQEREMITAIVKQRDLYRVLLAQSDRKFIEGDAATSLEAQESAVSMEKTSNSRDFDVEKNQKLQELQKEFEDYKLEKQMNVKLLQEALETERHKCSELRLAQMQAQVDATCSKERLEASETRCGSLETELVRLRSKCDQLSSLLLQNEQLVANADAKVEALTSRVQNLTVEKDSAVREAEYLRKNDDNLQQEVTTLRLDNTNLVKLMESTRRMESAREERDRHEVETLRQKVGNLEMKLHDAYEKMDGKEATCGAQVMAAEREKQALEAEVTKLKASQSALKEQFGRLEEQKLALQDKCSMLEKETTHLRDQLRKGASVTASERVATLELELRDAQRQVQASLVSRKTLTESVTKYKALAAASDANLAALSRASEQWKQQEEEKVQALEKTRDELTTEVTKLRQELKAQMLETNKVRDEFEEVEKRHKEAELQAHETQQKLQLQADNAVQQMTSVRDEMKRLKQDLDTTQANYERELQLHAAEVAKASANRRELELLRTRLHDREAAIDALNVKLKAVEKEAQGEISTLQKRCDDALEAKRALVEQNTLLHSQLQRAATQARRVHEQEVLKGVERQQEAGEEEGLTKEGEELRRVIAYLRRESAISESKLEIAQQEVQRGRAEIVRLTSTIERLRGEIKALNEAATSSRPHLDDDKRVAQLEQLSLLRESNATLRDENQKNLMKLKEEQTKVERLEAKLAPLEQAEAALKTQVASLKQEIETLNEANKRWKLRVEQLVEKYQQIDPAEHDKVVAEKEAVIKELGEVKQELETLRSSGGKELAEEKKKVENWSKQYERIKGFAKNWKNKAEMLTKQLGEKHKELDERTSAISTLEIKLSAVQAQMSTVTSEKAALETKLAACEAAKLEGVGATASWEKERQNLKAQLELETKKSTQLKDLNVRLMAGLKSLKKENSDLKDHAANATQSAEKTPMPSPPPSPLVPPSTTKSTPSKPADKPQEPSSAVSLETEPKPSIPAALSSPNPVATNPPPSSTSSPALAVPVQASVASIATLSTEIPPKDTSDNATEMSEGMTAEEKLRQFALRSIKKQVASAVRLKPVGTVSSEETTTENEMEPKRNSEFSLTGAGFGAFGAGGPSGLVFGKPGISLPVPSSPSSGLSPPPPPPLSLAGDTAPPESLRRSQRLARFGETSASSPAPAPAPAPALGPEVGASNLTKRPLAESGASVVKMAKTSEDQTATTPSEGKEEKEEKEEEEKNVPPVAKPTTNTPSESQ